jgi:SWI/SNF-related matrix-associated actin-dependent regulator 1 of chromatin subfamily A
MIIFGDKERGLFAAAADYDHRQEVKDRWGGGAWNADFAWPPQWIATIRANGDPMPGKQVGPFRRGGWVTTDAEAAARLALNGWQLDPVAAEMCGELAESFIERVNRARATEPWGDFKVFCPAGREPFPYQVAGVQRMRDIIQRHKGILLADQMGLGKTIQALLLLNEFVVKTRLGRKPNPCIVLVCPKSVVINWQREMAKWLLPVASPSDSENDHMPEWSIGVATPGHLPNTDIVILPWSVLSRATDHVDDLNDRGVDVLIADEVHYAKNPDAARTKAFYRFESRVALFMTGTPVPNRPREMFPVLNHLDPVTFPSRATYEREFCRGHMETFKVKERGDDGQEHEFIRQVWDNRGASNTAKLNDMLHQGTDESDIGCMIRREKATVLSQLPPKTRSVIEFPADTAELAAVVEAGWEHVDREAFEQALAALNASDPTEDAEGYAQAVDNLAAAAKVAFEDMSRVRRETAEAKVPLVAGYIDDLLEEVDKLVVFCHHHVMIDGLHDALNKAGVNHVVYDGRTPDKQRQPAIDTFNTDPECRVFVAQTTAAGVGLTLIGTEEHPCFTCLMAELDWVPGNIEQAEDRLHRIGQLNNVLVYHTVLEGSLDAYMARMLVEKMDVIDRTLDRRPEKAEVQVVELAEAPAQINPAQFRAGNIPLAAHDAVIKAIRILENNDPDRAGERNDIGWSGMHTPTRNDFIRSICDRVHSGRELTDGQLSAMRDVLDYYLGPNGQMQRLGLLTPQEIALIKSVPPGKRGQRRQEQRNQGRRW